MNVGYARVSSKDQNLDRQIAASSAYSPSGGRRAVLMGRPVESVEDVLGAWDGKPLREDG